MELSVGILLAVVSASLVGLCVYRYRKARNGKWHPYGDSIKLEMRRRLPSGSWEFRPATDEELAEYHATSAW
jgi:hypothetical protein